MLNAYQCPKCQHAAFIAWGNVGCHTCGWVACPNMIERHQLSQLIHGSNPYDLTYRPDYAMIATVLAQIAVRCETPAANYSLDVRAVG